MPLLCFLTSLFPSWVPPYRSLQRAGPEQRSPVLVSETRSTLPFFSRSHLSCAFIRICSISSASYFPSAPKLHTTNSTSFKLSQHLALTTVAVRHPLSEIFSHSPLPPTEFHYTTHAPRNAPPPSWRPSFLSTTPVREEQVIARSEEASSSTSHPPNARSYPSYTNPVPALRYIRLPGHHLTASSAVLSRLSSPKSLRTGAQNVGRRSVRSGRCVRAWRGWRHAEIGRRWRRG